MGSQAPACRSEGEGVGGTPGSRPGVSARFPLKLQPPSVVPSLWEDLPAFLVADSI